LKKLAEVYVVFWILGVMFVGAIFYAKWQIDQRKARWREIAQSLGGDCIETAWTCQVVVPIRPWTITLDTFTSASKTDTPNNTTYTRLRVPFSAHQDFGFLLLRRNVASRLLIETLHSPIGQLATLGNKKAQDHLQLFNSADVKLGDPRFDGSFILKSEQEEQARQLFAHVKSRVAALGDFQLFLIPYKGAGASVAANTMILQYQEKGIVTDAARVREICCTLEELVQELHRAGVASNQKPPIPTPLAM
jgi:hypothetical protein